MDMIFHFVSDSLEFAKGFEVGQIFEILRSGNKVVSKPVRVENKEQIEIMLDAMGCKYNFSGNLAGYWIHLNAEPMNPSQRSIK